MNLTRWTVLVGVTGLSPTRPAALLEYFIHNALFENALVDVSAAPATVDLELDQVTYSVTEGGTVVVTVTRGDDGLMEDATFGEIL